MSLPSSIFSVGDQVRHKHSGWAGDVLDIRPDDSGMRGSQGPLVTVRPTHPRPKETWDEALGRFVPTPADWPGWKPIEVTADELEKQ